MTMQEIINTEQELILSAFSLNDARQLGLLALSTCVERSLPVTVSITHCGQIAFQCAMDGSAPDNDRVMICKRRVVELSHHSSLWYKERLAARGDKNGQDAMALSSLEYMFFGGSIPIRVEGIGVVGTLTISGLKDTEDHALAVELLQMFKNSK